MIPAAAPGWYGKLSMLGDFASRRLAPEWVQACDRWLAGCITGSQQQLGDSWLQAYLGAPLWRFAWAPGVVDAQWWFGVLMPSCDNVGRYFPLLVATERAAAPQDRAGLEHLEQWWDGVAQAAMHTLAEGGEVQRFEQALAALPPWPAAPPAPVTEPGGLVGNHILSGPATLAEIAAAFASTRLVRQLQGHSFWWPWRPGQPAGRCRLFAGLPAAADFAELLAP